MMLVDFAIGKYEISHFLAVLQFNSRESQITCFLGIGQVFCLGTFLVVICTYTFFKKKQVFPRRVQRKWISNYFLT